MSRSRLASAVAGTMCFCNPCMNAQDTCPSPAALDLFRHEVAYQRTEELNPLKGLATVNANVWQRGSDTGFYIRDSVSGYPPNTRLVYSFDQEGIQGYFGCQIAEDWNACVQKSFPPAGSDKRAQTCATTIDLRDIPAWAPSPDSAEKRKVAGELMAQITVKWPAAQEIVIRDFNLKDAQAVIYLKMPDGDYVQGCALRQCEFMHSFGMVPNSKIKDWIFEKPYRLK